MQAERVERGLRSGEQPLEIFVATCERPSDATHVLDERLSELLRDGKFAAWLETLCKDSEAEGERPSIPPGVSFGMLFVPDF